jgi:hypothetical protein
MAGAGAHPDAINNPSHRSHSISLGSRGLNPERTAWLDNRGLVEEEEEEKEAEQSAFTGWEENVGGAYQAGGDISSFNGDFTAVGGAHLQSFTPAGRRASHVFGISGPTAHLSVLNEEDEEDGVPSSPVFDYDDDEEDERRRKKEKTYCGLGLWLYITVVVLALIIAFIVLLVVKAPEREVACNTNPNSEQCASAKKGTFLTIFITIVSAFGLLCLIQCRRCCGGGDPGEPSSRNKVAVAWEQQERDARDREMRLAHTALYVQEVEAQEQEEAWETSLGMDGLTIGGQDSGEEGSESGEEGSEYGEEGEESGAEDQGSGSDGSGSAGSGHDFRSSGDGGGLPGNGIDRREGVGVAEGVESTAWGSSPNGQNGDGNGSHGSNGSNGSNGSHGVQPGFQPGAQSSMLFHAQELLAVRKRPCSPTPSRALPHPHLRNVLLLCSLFLVSFHPLIRLFVYLLFFFGVCCFH